MANDVLRNGEGI